MFRQCRWLAISLVVFCGCEKKHTQVPALPPIVVTVAKPIDKEVTQSQEFEGNTQAIETVEVRARVTGYLQEVNFTSGDLVKEGQQLFLIDPRPYQAQLDKAKADVDRAQATLDLSKSTQARDLQIAQTPGAISQQSLDVNAAKVKESEAALKASQAAVAINALNLSWTKVTAPITGRIDRNYMTVGNLISADVTILTNIIKFDPMYTYFSVDERTVLDVQEMQRKTGTTGKASGVQVGVRLQTEKDYKHFGKIDFFGNKLDVSTGTLTVRAVVPNKDRYFSPGNYVRVRVPVGQSRKMLLVHEQALGTDQGQKFVYVVSPEKKVEYRKIKVGMQDGVFRVIEDGIKDTDWIIVRGIQRVRPDEVVQTQQAPMSDPEAVEKAPTTATPAQK